MVAPGARFIPLLVLAGLTALVAAMLFGPGGYPVAHPQRTNEVAALSEPPPAASSASRPTERASPTPAATAAPEPTPGPTTGPTGPAASVAPPPTGLVEGSVDRTSLDLVARYDVNASITAATGALDVATTIVVRNDGKMPIDRLELNTIAARLGKLRVTTAMVDEEPVKVRIKDQTLLVPLGGVLEPGATTTVLVAYRATLTNSIRGSDWMFSRYAGTLALYRWVPWISRATPFDRPNIGDPFVTVSSPEVSVEILSDRPLVLAAPAAKVAVFEAGASTAWAFTLRDVRDVSVVLAPDFQVVKDKVGDVTVMAYARSGSLAADRLLALTSQALREEAAQLDVDYPWPALVAVETMGGEGLESPGLIWIPRGLDTLNRTYIVHHEVAHQWFYGLVGNDQRNQPFADEAAADFLARTVLGTFRATRCGRTALDGSIARYSGRCYYEVLYVQGGLFLEDVRSRMGTKRFWKALGDYLEDNRFGIATTRDLLEALQSGSEVSLKALYRSRFPSLF